MVTATRLTMYAQIWYANQNFSISYLAGSMDLKNFENFRPLKWKFAVGTQAILNKQLYPSTLSRNLGRKFNPSFVLFPKERSRS